MPRFLFAALIVGAIVVADTLVPSLSLVTFPDFHPKFAISVSLQF